jgi:hypothetical protein
MSEMLIIPQGTDCSIHASGVQIGGVSTDMTGWAVRAVIRERSTDGSIVAEWSSDPLDLVGEAVPGNAVLDLKVTPAMSSLWGWRHGVVQAEVTEPGEDGRVARVISKTVYLDPEAVRD